MERREFIKQLGLGVIAVTVGGGKLLLTPRQARAQGAAFAVLSAREAALLEAFGETLLPGAAEEGIAHFVDYHLSVPPADSLLMLRYLDVPPPYADFYRAGLATADAIGKGLYRVDARHRKRAAWNIARSMPELAGQRAEAVGFISHQQPEGWQGFPAPLFYFAVRADAVDVVYGTEEGFAKLDIPYMAHIAPPSKWGEDGSNIKN